MTDTPLSGLTAIVPTRTTKLLGDNGTADGAVTPAALFQLLGANDIPGLVPGAQTAAQVTTAITTMLAALPDGTTLVLTGGKLSVVGAVPTVASPVPTLAAARFLLADGTYATGAALGVGGGGAPTLTLTMPTGVQPGTSYTINGTFTNDGTSPVLQLSVDAGAFGALPAGSTVTGGAISLSMPGLSSGTHTAQVRDGNGVLSNTVSYSVATAETLTVTTPGAQVAGTGFAVAGTYANGTPAALDYSLDGGTTWAAASGPTISGGSYSIPGVVVPTANASQVVKVRDHGAQSIVGVSGAFAVSAAAAPGGASMTLIGATFGPGKFGQALTGGTASKTLTLANSADRTYEFWFKAAAPDGAAHTIMQIGGGHDLSVNATGQLVFGDSQQGQICDGTWHYVALMLRPAAGGYGQAVFTDGNNGGFGVFGGGTDNPTVALGGFGQIDEFRVSAVGRVAGAAAVVPTTAYVKDSDTLLLTHLDGDGAIQ